MSKSFRVEIFIDDKPDYYDFAIPKKKMTGDKFMEKFRGKQKRGFRVFLKHLCDADEQALDIHGRP